MHSHGLLQSHLIPLAWVASKDVVEGPLVILAMLSMSDEPDDKSAVLLLLDGADPVDLATLVTGATFGSIKVLPAHHQLGGQTMDIAALVPGDILPLRGLEEAVADAAFARFLLRGFGCGRGTTHGCRIGKGEAIEGAGDG